MSNLATTQFLSFLRISTKYVRNLHTSLTHITSKNSILKAMKEISRINLKGGDARGKNIKKITKQNRQK